MSHFNAVRTALTDGDLLQQCIRESGFRVETNYHVRGYNNTAVEADIVAVLDGDYDLGFQLQGGSYAAVGDFSLGSCGGGSKKLEIVLAQIVAKYKTKEAHKASAAVGAGLANSTINVRVQ